MKKTVCLIVALLLCVLSAGIFNCSAAVVADGEGYHLFGDANDDSQISIVDLVRMKKYLVKPLENDICECAADIDSDGVISGTDLIQFRDGFLGVDNYLRTGGDYWSDIY